MILYTQQSCPQCRMIHVLLDKKKNIQYDECQDIEEMKKVGVNHTPAANINGQIIQGKALIDYIKSAT